jgi:predicted amidohydrolase
VGIHEPTDDGKRLKNTLVWIDENGELVKRYQKIHLFDVDIEKGPRLKESEYVRVGIPLTHTTLLTIVSIQLRRTWLQNNTAIPDCRWYGRHAYLL